jgi:hypothetical protein
MAYGVDIEPGDWTPIRNQVFTDILGDLKGRHAAALYLYLYDWAYHSPSKSIVATVAELARLTGIDARTANKCLAELRQLELIRQVRQGIKHSKAKTRRPVWKVPLAPVDLREGNWTPVPRNLVREYFPAYPNAVLLPLLIFYQHMNRQKFCWVGVTTLRKRLNWCATRVRDSLCYMFDEKNWRSLHPDLPWPLRRKIVINKEGQRRRRFSVLAIEYEGSGKTAKMRLSKSFRMAFDLL